MVILKSLSDDEISPPVSPMPLSSLPPVIHD
ncbi:hypothetical protein A2U01_0114758, partial [Trifolium medium]|nr:hypothetical protein [Trifolium medium]